METAILAASSDEAVVAAAEGFLRGRMAERDAADAQVHRIVDRTAGMRTSRRAT